MISSILFFFNYLFDLVYFIWYEIYSSSLCINILNTYDSISIENSITLFENNYNEVKTDSHIDFNHTP